MEAEHGHTGHRHGEWLEVWSCFPSPDVGQRWFVDHCTRGGKSTVADCDTAAEAYRVAAGWKLPVISIQA